MVDLVSIGLFSELTAHLLLRVSVAPIGVLVVVADRLLSAAHQAGVELRLRLVAEVFGEHEVLEVLVSPLPPQSLGVGVHLAQLQVAGHSLPGTSVVVVMFLNIKTCHSLIMLRLEGGINPGAFVTPSHVGVLSVCIKLFPPEQHRFDRQCKGSASSSPR